MAANSTWSGLRALAARAGLAKPAANTTIDDDDDADDAAAAGGADDDDDGDDATTTPPAGDDAGDDAGGDDAGNDGEGDDDGAGNDGGEAQPQAGGGKPKRSADFLAGQRFGAQQAYGRVAATLLSPVARANLEMATDLLANSTMSADAIIQMCDRYKGEGAAQKLLDSTPRVKLGADKSGGKAGADDAATARKSATAKVNARTSGGRRGAAAAQPVRGSRRAQTPAADGKE